MSHIQYSHLYFFTTLYVYTLCVLLRNCPHLISSFYFSKFLKFVKNILNSSLTFHPVFKLKSILTSALDKEQFLCNFCQCILLLMTTGHLQTSFAFILQFTFPEHRSPPLFPWRKRPLRQQTKLKNIFLHLCLSKLLLHCCVQGGVALKLWLLLEVSVQPKGRRTRKSCCCPSYWSLVHSIFQKKQNLKIFLSCILARYLGATLQR